MPRRTFLSVFTVAFMSLGFGLGSCSEQAALTLRTDPEPLTRRLNLPKSLQSVRWVAVSPTIESGWLPPRIEFYKVYAYIDLDDQEWTEMENTAGPSRPGTVVLADDVAALLLPPAAAKEFVRTQRGFQATGPCFNASALAIPPKGEVDAAVRIGTALVVRMIAR